MLTGRARSKPRRSRFRFYASWPSSISTLEGLAASGRLNQNYQQITDIMSRANSTYEAAVLRDDALWPQGLSLHAHYTYAHAMDWNPNEKHAVAGSDVLDPADFSQEYGTSNLDVRHSAAVMSVYEAPWKLHGARRALGEWLDAFGNRAVPQRPALHHAHLRARSPRNSRHRHGHRGPGAGNERLRRRQSRVWRGAQHLSLSGHVEGRHAPGQALQPGADARNWSCWRRASTCSITRMSRSSRPPAIPSNRAAPWATPPTLNFLTGPVCSDGHSQTQHHRLRAAAEHQCE